jgi:hypothetical protein
LPRGLEEAVVAYSAALEERTRERVPFQWAGTQNNLGNALRIIGERESGTAGLNEAVSAFSEALKELTPKRSPIDWASTFGDQGVAMSLIADRTNDGAMSETAVAQIAAAYETLRGGGQKTWARMFQAQLPKAQAIRDRLKGKRATLLHGHAREFRQRRETPMDAGRAAVSDTGRTPAQLRFDIVDLFPLLRPSIRERNW